MPIDHYYHAASLTLGYTDYIGGNKRSEKIGCLNFSKLLKYTCDYLEQSKEIYQLTKEYENNKIIEIINKIMQFEDKFKSNIFPNKSSESIFNDIRLDEALDRENNKNIQKIERDFCKLLENIKIDEIEKIPTILESNQEILYKYIKLTISRSPAFNTSEVINVTGKEINDWFELNNPMENQTLSIGVTKKSLLFLNDSLPIFPLLSNNFLFPEAPWKEIFSVEEYNTLKQAKMWFFPISHNIMLIMHNKDNHIKNILANAIRKQEFFNIVFSINLLMCSTYIVFKKEQCDYFLENAIRCILRNHQLKEIRKNNYNSKLFKYIHKNQKN